MSNLSDAYIGRPDRNQRLLDSQFIHKPSSNRESLELVAPFRSAYPTDAMKPDRARHQIESRQDKFDLNFDPHGRTLCREYEHSTLAYVHAVPSVVVFHGVGPAEQKWQRNLKSLRIPPLDRLIHIRTQCLPGCLTISARRAAPQAGNSP